MYQKNTLYMYVPNSALIELCFCFCSKNNKKRKAYSKVIQAELVNRRALKSYHALKVFV